MFAFRRGDPLQCGNADELADSGPAQECGAFGAKITDVPLRLEPKGPALPHPPHTLPVFPQFAAFPHRINACTKGGKTGVSVIFAPRKA